MKKILLLTLLGLFCISEYSIASEFRLITPPQDHWFIDLKFIFHRPRTNCQSGFGICLIVSAGNEDEDSYPGQPTCDGRGRVNERNQLIIQVSEPSLNKYEKGAALPFFEGKSSFTLPDPYTLPDATCKALGLSSEYTLKPGTYPMSYENGNYTVTFY